MFLALSRIWKNEIAAMDTTDAVSTTQSTVTAPASSRRKLLNMRNIVEPAALETGLEVDHRIGPARPGGANGGSYEPVPNRLVCSAETALPAALIMLSELLRMVV